MFEEEDRIVAFIDILGFKELVNRTRDDMNLRDILYDALRMKSVYAEIIRKGQFGVRNNNLTIQSTAFSDCIVISAKFAQIEQVILSSATLAGLLLRNKILCRGGIAAGRMIHDDRVLIGMGFINAYEIEQSAVYPRIIIQYDLEKRKGPFITRLLRDSDGLWFIDIFDQLKVWGNEDDKPGLLNLPPGAPWPDIGAFQSIREFIVLNLKETRVKRLFYMKYLWLANRFNGALNEYVPGMMEPIPL